jgi:hypothetical protein
MVDSRSLIVNIPRYEGHEVEVFSDILESADEFSRNTFLGLNEQVITMWNYEFTFLNLNG